MNKLLAILALALAAVASGQTVVCFRTNRVTTGGAAYTTNRMIITGERYYRFGAALWPQYTNEVMRHVCVKQGTNVVSTWFEQLEGPTDFGRLSFFIDQMNRQRTNGH